SSRTNNRPEPATPDEAFVLVSWITVMIFPFVCSLFEPYALVAPVKPGKSRQIVANETANRRLRLLARSHCPGREQRFPGSTHVPFSVFSSAGKRASAPSGRPRREAVRRSRCRRP